MLPSLLFFMAGAQGQTLVPYSLPRAGKVSLAVYDSQGTQLRTLLAGDPQTPGGHTARWDGLDRLGRPLPAGTYTWKLLLNDGLGTRPKINRQMVRMC
jgi:flagellar hook assembly protein FlgD